MKNSKLFITSLIAAAAMSTVPAWAETKTQSGGTGTITADATYDLIEVKNGGTLNQSSGTVSTTKFQLHNAANSNTDTYNLSGGVLNVTSTTKTAGTDVALGHWPSGSGILNVSETGVFNVTSGLLNISRDGNGTLSISGGEVNAYGITLSPDKDSGNYAGNALLQMTGGRLNVGVGGIIGVDASYSGTKTKVINLNGGTLGALDSWSSSATMTIGGNVTIDTTKWVSSATVAGASATGDNTGATITLSGNITQTADTTLTVSGAGTLKLSGTSTLNGSVTVDSGATLDLSGATNVKLSSAITNSGTVKVNSNTVFVLAMTGTDNTYTLISSGGTISGWDSSTLSISNFRQADGSTFSGRSTVNVATAGSVTITETTGNLVWSGGESGNWNYSTDNTPWTLSGGTETTSFMIHDNVTFSTANATITVDSAGVTAGTMTVSAATTLSGTGTVSVAAANLTTSASATLTLDSGVTLDLGNLENDTNVVHTSLAGTGTVVIEKTGTGKNHGQTINLGNAFAGTVNYSGNLNPVNATFGSDSATVNFTDVWFWSESSGTIAQKLNFSGTGNKSTNGTLDLTGEITSSAGAEFSLGGGTLNISGASTANIATLKLTGKGSTLNFSGTGTKTIGTLYAQDTDGTSRTISIAEGTTVSVGNITNSWGIKTLTVDGTLNVTGTMTYSSGNMMNTITGSGTLTAKTFAAGNNGTYVFSDGLNTNITTLTASADPSGKTTTTFSNTGTNTIGTLTVNARATVNISGTLTKVTGVFSGAGTLNVNDVGVLEIVGADGDSGNSTNQVEGTVNVKGGGTLKFSGHDLMGWGGTVNTAVVLAGTSEEKVARLNINDSTSLTLSRNITMSGNALISTTSSSSFNSLGGKITATGTNNKISDVGVKVRENFEIAVTNDSNVLEIASPISGFTNNSGALGSGGITKTGTGTLILSGDNSGLSTGYDSASKTTTRRTITVSAGTVVAKTASALGSTATTVNEGGVLKVSVNGGVNVGDGSATFKEGAKFAIDLTAYEGVTADAALTIITASAISFNGGNTNTVAVISDDIENYFSATDSDLGEWVKYTRTWSNDNGKLTLTLTIPEPSTFGLLAGVGALALVAARRRRRKTK